MLRAASVVGLLFLLWVLGRLLAAAWQLVPRPGVGFFALSFCCWLTWQVCGDTIADGLQLLETPVYAGAYDSLGPDAKAAAFERILQQQVSPEHFGLIQQQTAATAAKLGVAPADIYAVCYAECGLNPFVRNVQQGRTVAAGWIQFTGVGCQSVPGLNMKQVQQACDSRDAARMLQWSDAYLVSAAAGKPLRGALDVYLCLFAPSKVGAPAGEVLYKGYDNPAYYQNAGIDGWVKQPNGRILRLRSRCDGIITVGELGLRLEYFTNKICQE